MVEDLSPAQRSAIERARHEPSLRPLLLRKAKGLRWFRPFRAEGFLDPNLLPPPIPSSQEGFVSVPPWPVTEYLVSIAGELEDPGNAEIADEVLEFIRRTTLDAKARGVSNHRVWWNFAKTFQCIPLDRIAATDVDLVDYWLSDPYERGLTADVIGGTWLPRVIQVGGPHASGLALRALAILFDVSYKDQSPGGPRLTAVFRMEPWYAKRIVDAVAGLAGSQLGLDAVEFFRGQLRNVLDRLGNDKWSAVWRPAIEEHEQNRSSESAENILVDALRDSLGAYVRRPDKSEEYIRGVVADPSVTVKRIAIHAVSESDGDEAVSVATTVEYYSAGLRHEQWHLLRKRFPNFRIREKAAVRAAIESLEAFDSGDKDRNERATAYERSIWLAAIKDVDEEAATLYAKYVAQAGAEPERPDFTFYVWTGWVSAESPIPVDELLGLKPSELVERLSAYEPTEQDREAGLEGLSRAFRAVVKQRAVEFGDHLQKLAGLRYSYLHACIEAYAELLNEATSLPWARLWAQLADFLEVLVVGDRLWARPNEQGDGFVANRNWVVSSIGMLLESGVRSKDAPIPAELTERFLRVLELLIVRTPPSEIAGNGDPVFTAINSPRGRCLEAVISFARVACRESRDGALDSSSHVGWSRFEPSFNSELSLRKDGVYEFVTLVAMRLGEFLRMNSDWVKRNLRAIFDCDNRQSWLCGIDGYSHVGRFHLDIYSFLKSEGHLSRAFGDPLVTRSARERLLRDTVWAYLAGHEELLASDGGLAGRLNEFREEDIGYIIWFVWTGRETKDEAFRAKVFVLWREILSRADASTGAGRRARGHLRRWADFIVALGPEDFGLLMETVQSSVGSDGFDDVLEAIARLSRSWPFEAAEIWSATISEGRPTYPEEAIEAAFRNLLAAGSEGRHRADSIAKQYLDGGNDQPLLMLVKIMEAAN